MRRESLLGGLGGVAFSVMTIVGFFAASPPGGEYSAGDMATYVDDGHRAAVFVGLYLGLLGVVGLLFLLAHLRDAARTGPSAVLRRVFWSSGLLGAAAFALGWAVLTAVPLSQGLGGAPAIDPSVAYEVTQAGWLMMIGVGGVALGASLVTLSFAAAAAVPAWLRWLTLLCGLLGFASLAWFPFYALFLWALVAGAWLVLGRREPAPVAAAA